jgi:integrase
MASYICKHHRGGWRYTYHIPEELRPLFPNKKTGKPNTAFRRLIKPGTCTRKEADLQGMRWALEDAATLALCREQPEQYRLALAAVGGLPEDSKPASDTRMWQGTSKDPVGDWARAQAQKLQAQIGERTAAAVASWDRLLAQWQKQTEAREPRAYERTIRALKELFPDADCRKITTPDFAKFRDLLKAQGKSRGAIKAHLERAHAMYKAAAKDPIDNAFHDCANPVREVSLAGKNERRKTGDKVFTPPEVRTIFKVAREVRFGDTNRLKRHEKIMWAIRLAAYGGFRDDEIFQLQGGDVDVSYNGVKFIWVRHTDAVSAQPHPLKSVKNDQERMVPLHPEVHGFLEFARQFAKDEFIFADFKWSKEKGRCAWIFDNFGSFLREVCKIVDANRPKLRFYSFRHTFKTQMRLSNPGIDLYWIDCIMGHGKDIPASYGGGPEELPRLAEYVARVKY